MFNYQNNREDCKIPKGYYILGTGFLSTDHLDYYFLIRQKSTDVSTIDYENRIKIS